MAALAYWLVVRGFHIRLAERRLHERLANWYCDVMRFL